MAEKRYNPHIQYNEEKLLTEIIYDDGTKEVYTYDEDKNRNSITDRNGRTRRFKYDERGNLIAEIMPEPFNYTVRYSYDGNNRRTKSALRQAVLQDLSMTKKEIS